MLKGEPFSGYSKLLRHGLRLLHPYQLDIIERAIDLGSGALALDMGLGKTLCSIVLGLYSIENTNRRILVICSKTLINTWICEIDKFFEGKLKYVVYHQDNVKNLHSFKLTDEKLVITTSEVVTKFYKMYEIENKFIQREIVNEGLFNQHEIVHYIVPKKPLVDTHFFYSTNWGLMAVDEAHKYTNVKVLKCKCILAIAAKHKWCLSGTIFMQPAIERMLGYYLMTNNTDLSDNIPRARDIIKSDDFIGYGHTLIKKDEKFENIGINFTVEEHTIMVPLSFDEMKIYMMMKDIVMFLSKQIKVYKDAGDSENLRKFNAYLLAMLIYLRQSLTSPLIPITNMIIDFYEYKNKNELTGLFLNKLKELNVGEYLDDERNVKSGKINKVIKICKKHKKVIIFTSFRTTLDLVISIFNRETDMKIITLESKMDIKKRGKIIEEFNSSENIILILTYSIGSEGLNLQTCDTCIIMDEEWSYGIRKQAIARIIRPGQMSPVVNVYYLISNTGVEKAIFNKQKEKCGILRDLLTGGSDISISKIKVAEIITIIAEEENIENFESINK